MAVSLEKFVQQLEGSGIVAGETLKDFIPPNASPKSAEELALELIRNKKLTKFQAEEISRGKAKSLVLGNYVLMEKIGAGGMGQVFRARHRVMNRVVAIKVLPASMTRDEAAIARFHREVQAAAKLNHPNIVTAHDADQAGGVHFLVMELVEGIDLSEHVKTNGPLPYRKAVNYILQAAKGLEAAHKKGIVHRDIKPANLLLDTEGTVKILDMGLARLSGDGDAANQTDLTNTGTIMGTVDYMSPEQAMNSKNADHRSDLYSLGISLFYLLNGKAAYGGDTVMERLLAHRDHPIPSLRDSTPDVPEQLQSIFEKMIAKDAKDRYQTMREVIIALENCGQVDAQTESVQPSLGDQTIIERDSGYLSRSSTSPLPTSKQLNSQSNWSPDDVAGQGNSLDDKGIISPASKTSAIAMKLTEKSVKKGNVSILQDHQKLLLIGGGLLGIVILLVAVAFSSRSTTVKPTETAKLQPSGSKPEVAASGWQGWPADAPKPAIAPFDAAQARQHQEDWAKYLGVPVEYTNSLGMKFVLIPPGEFMMGSTAAEIEIALKEAGENTHWPEKIKSEAPRHKVVLTQPIYLGVHEVTQAKYEKVMGTNPSQFAPTGMGKDAVVGLETTEHPVENVSWNDAAEFCAKLSQQESRKPFYSRVGETIMPLDGTGYRLPSESEWEFACRAGTTAKFWIGDKDEELVRAGWFNLNGGERTHPVGELKANPFGLADIHGNVWEWVQDGWDATCYQQFSEKPEINPQIPFSAGFPSVMRGGDSGLSASHSRSSHRFAGVPNWRYPTVGFRVAMVIDSAGKQSSNSTMSLQGNKPVAPVVNKQLFFQTPGFDPLANKVAAMPAEKQVEGRSALKFDGIDDFVELPSWKYDGNGPVTMEALVVPQGEGVRTVAHLENPVGMGLYRISGLWHFNYYSGAGNMQSFCLEESPGNAPLGQATHLAGVWTPQRQCLFVNGKAWENVHVNYYPKRAGVHILGAARPSGPEPSELHFSGLFWGFRVSRVSRYDKPFTPPNRFEKDDDTLLLYRFDEGQGDVLHDASGHGHAGKISGAKWVKSRSDY